MSFNPKKALISAYLAALLAPLEQSELRRSSSPRMHRNGGAGRGNAARLKREARKRRNVRKHAGGAT